MFAVCNGALPVGERWHSNKTVGEPVTSSRTAEVRLSNNKLGEYY